MMDVFLTAQGVSQAIAVPAGATEYYWRLIDQAEAVLIPNSNPIALAGESEITVTVDASYNTLVAPELRALRVIEAYFTTTAGTVKVSVEYMVEAEQTLVVNQNTFQTYGEAVLTSYDLFGVPAWANASKNDRTGALIAARRNIAQLRFRYVFDAYQDRVEATIGVSDLTMISDTNWKDLPVDFVAALKRAQILEADFLLAGGENPVDAKRRLGIISETIGESSMFMRSSKPLEGPVCKRALKELAKYRLNRVRTTRS